MRSTTSSKTKFKRYRVYGYAFLCLIWIVLSALEGGLFLPQPWTVLRRAARFFAEPDARVVLLQSFARAGLAFVLAWLAAYALAVFSYERAAIRGFLDPLLQVMKTVPLVSFTLLLLLWTKKPLIPTLVSFIMLFPILFEQFYRALDAIDPRLSEAVRVFKVPFARRWRYLYPEVLREAVIGTIRTGTSIAFKAAVAAEVLVIAQKSLGAELSLARTYLDSESLLAITLWVIVLAAILKGLALLAVRLNRKRRARHA